jgi:hypothetical protein
MDFGRDKDNVDFVDQIYAWSGEMGPVKWLGEMGPVKWAR